MCLEQLFEARLKQEGDRKALLGKEAGKEEARGDYEHTQTGEETEVGLEKRTKSMCGTYWGAKKWHKLGESVYNQKTHHILKSAEGRTTNPVRRLKSGARKCKEQNQMLKCRILGPCVCISSLLPSIGGERFCCCRICRHCTQWDMICLNLGA